MRTAPTKYSGLRMPANKRSGAWSVTTCGTLAVVALAGAVYWLRRSQIPSHLLGHPVVYEPHMLSPEIAQRLMDFVVEPTNGEFATVAADLAFYNTTHEHIGEAQELVNGRCEHPFLAPSADRSLCVLPGRIDVGRSFIQTGGADGLKELPESLITRAQSFARYYYNFSSYPLMTELFGSPRFQELAKAVCPPHQQVLDPIQFNLIVNLPGQSVALHLDAPYFWGADRFHVPQWLLASMVFSGLWQDEFIHQVQVVAYFHQWNDTTGERHGDFVYHDDASGIPKSVPPAPLSASSVDGSKLIHAARVYMPDRRPPPLDKSKRNTLRFDGDSGRWVLTSGGERVATYQTDELRFSVVYRARCFTDEAERARFAAQKRGTGPDDNGDMMPLEEILDKLKADMVAKGLTRHSRTGLDAMSKLELAMAIMDAYIRYPPPPASSAIFPANYCAAQLLVPAWMKGLFTWICN